MSSDPFAEIAAGFVTLSPKEQARIRRRIRMVAGIFPDGVVYLAHSRHPELFPPRFKPKSPAPAQATVPLTAEELEETTRPFVYKEA